jgi:hypothetical protein
MEDIAMNITSRKLGWNVNTMDPTSTRRLFAGLFSPGLKKPEIFEAIRYTLAACIENNTMVKK